MWRIIAKAKLRVTCTKGDIMEAAGPLQLCAGQEAGMEAVIHVVHFWFDSGTTEGVLLVDASNDFNILNHQSTFLNVQHLCPSLSTILIKCYREALALCVDGSVQ